MSQPSAKKRAEWKIRAARKDAIVPRYFEVFPHKVQLECGHCGHSFSRTLVPNIDEPIFVCPIDACKARNWVPVRFKLSR